MKPKSQLRALTMLLVLSVCSVFSYAQEKVNVSPSSKPMEQLKPNKVNSKYVNGILEQKSVMDNVIADDLIVQGDGCFGIDCINNENFGINTIKLKANNLRIGFDDTSTGAFPANDWELEANESASGGLNAFSILDVTGGKIPFRIEAAARTNALYVKSDGNVGIGTNNPILDIQMKTGNTPGVRLEQDNSSGFTAQTWDVAGNEANFFVRDITNGSKLPFRIRPNAPTSSIDIASTGNVGIGTSTPTVKLQVEGNGYFLGNLYAKEAILPGASSPSDRKLKKNIEDFTGAGSIIKQLSPKTYYYNTEKFPDVGLPSAWQFGLIAQEVEPVLPNLVANNTHPSGLTFKTVNYTGLIPVLVKAVQEQQTEIEVLKHKLSEYESLNARLNSLEALLKQTESFKSTDK
ncbi:MAG: tail fiber domain-containing protein [Cytophagaceae bacterium]|nr:tail fiber domain-containing protein [Cytophagaceae bacterium]